MRLNVELTNEIYAEMAVHAERLGRSLSDIVRALVIDWNVQQRSEAAGRPRGIESGRGRRKHEPKFVDAVRVGGADATARSVDLSGLQVAAGADVGQDASPGAQQT